MASRPANASLGAITPASSTVRSFGTHVLLRKRVCPPLPAPGGADDPTSSGAAGGGVRLSILNQVTGEAAVYALPASGWTGGGTPAGASGYKYKDPHLINGPCKTAGIKHGSLRASCRGARVGLSLDETAVPTFVVAFP